MTRSARERSESGFYHVVAKGNGGQNLFEDASDYRAFLELAAAAAEKCDILVYAYCLMSNHVHLLLEDRGNRLSDFMKSLITGYAMRFNAKTGHIGHVFQQRFKSQPVESETYLLQAARYIHNNPAKAGVCSADEYLWSSYHEYASGVRGITAVSLILELCGGREGFRAFQARGGKAIIALASVRGSPTARPETSRCVSLAILPRETSKRWSDHAAMRYSLTLRMRACPCVRSRG